LSKSATADLDAQTPESRGLGIWLDSGFALRAPRNDVYAK
jgi:hypothetical protein